MGRDTMLEQRMLADLRGRLGVAGQSISRDYAGSGLADQLSVWQPLVAVPIRRVDRHLVVRGSVPNVGTPSAGVAIDGCTVLATGSRIVKAVPLPTVLCTRMRP